ncbi:hypothetical protein [Altericroceibacterium endophyticum]|uniref:Uncharacterized protein n=1 Tax=Altericroceibacterium endophyticum TaxID=1808508 RepID=A0A6I4T733_9SPHN|nr:hypothetical protein [Altericroceibacterium endophyticum]MXO66289.1 hypothetical protein [Altericroceibacterium endophyticum]
MAPPRKDLAKDREGDDSVAVTRRAFIRYLQGIWPNSADVSPADLSVEVSDKQFLATAVDLQDAGLIMYEAIVFGAQPFPVVNQVMLTRKGQLLKFND